MKIEAVAYCRVSSKGQQKNGTGLDRQEDDIRSFAEQNGYNLTRVYYEAHTGTETVRPILEDVIVDLTSNGCRVVIVECLDRLARDLAVQMQLIALLRSKKITLINAMTGDDATNPKDPMAKAMLQVQGAFAELDKSLIVKKLKRGRDKARAKAPESYREGRQPFGFRDGETVTVERIKALYRKKPGEDRLTCHAIAKVLNREDRPTRTGALWSNNSVKTILKRLGILK
jgi:DNA invertase Pin-like site-specific DNA recombinase